MAKCKGHDFVEDEEGVVDFADDTEAVQKGRCWSCGVEMRREFKHVDDVIVDDDGNYFSA